MENFKKDGVLITQTLNTTLLNFLEKNANFEPKYNIMASLQTSTAASLFFEHHKEVIPYHTTYLLAQKNNIDEKIGRLQKEHPGLPLTKVVTSVLCELPENMAPRLVRELTLYIIESWEEVSIGDLKKA
jgi:hypothetical protein